MTALLQSRFASKVHHRAPGPRPAPHWFEREAETMPRDKLARLQLKRLRATLKNAYEHVTLHRLRMDEAGMRPRDVRSLDDLRQLPFTQKSDLRDWYPFGMFARPREKLARVHASSGTTGKPTVVGYTKKDLATWAGLMARSLACAGVHPGDVVHNALGYGLFTGGLGFHEGAQRLGCTVVPASGGVTERQVLLLQDFGARVLCATPSYALAIAEAAERQGVDLRQGALEVGVFGAEPWSEAMRREIESRLGLKSADNYGLSEVMGPGVAVECEAQAGMHGWEDHFIFEIVDPATGHQLPEGGTGELVVTTLTKEALPMIRYRTRDITRIESRRCDCGRTHLRLARITGRSDDMLIIRGVNVYPSQIEATLVGLPQVTPHYQLVVERRGALDALTIEVEASPGVRSDDAEAHRAIAERVRHHIKSMIGVTVEVAVKQPGEVPRSEGKAVRVRDLRPRL
jgi:phenylacetate-CoA ligase